MLATYVHDMGGGLVMIGGPDTFGAGGWQGSEVEKILPVDMDIPAQRQVGKGALVLIMHSCEMPEGNYWGEQCALQAVADALAARRGRRHQLRLGRQRRPAASAGAVGLPARPTSATARASTAAIKKMQLGDMPSFDDALNLAINGVNGGPGLAKSNARHKHIIIISDGDPSRPSRPLMDQCQAEQGQRLDRHRLPPRRRRRPTAAAAGDGRHAQARLARRQGVRADRDQPQPAAADLHQGGDDREAEPDPRGPERGIPINVRDPADEHDQGHPQPAAAGAAAWC